MFQGFPSETEEQFQETYESLQKTSWTRLHVFPYSLRPGTLATKIKCVVSEVQKRQRSLFLRNLSASRLLGKFENQVHQTKKILILKNKESLVGLSRDYWSVHFQESTLNQTQFFAGEEVELPIVAFEPADGPRGGVLIA